MSKVTDRILWTVLILAIGIGIFMFGKPAYQQIIKSSTQNLSHSMNQWNGATLVNEQFASGNTGSANSGDFTYVGNFDNHENTGDRNTHLFNVNIANGVYHMSSDSSMPADGHVAGFYVHYKNTNGNTFDTGDSLNASVQVKGVGHLYAFGSDGGPGTVPSQQINTHGQWQTLTYQLTLKSADDIYFRSLVFYLYYQPNTDLYVRNVDVQIH